MRQPEEVGEESSILEKEVNGEIQIISFCMEFHKIMSSKCFSKCEITSKF